MQHCMPLTDYWMVVIFLIYLRKVLHLGVLIMYKLSLTNRQPSCTVFCHKFKTQPIVRVIRLIVTNGQGLTKSLPSATGR